MVATHLKTAPGPAPSANGAPKLDVAAIVASVIDDVRKDGDAAVRKYSDKFDKWSPESFKLSVSHPRPSWASARWVTES
jgi:histidinol dehydrogenase